MTSTVRNEQIKQTEASKVDYRRMMLLINFELYWNYIFPHAHVCVYAFFAKQLIISSRNLYLLLSAYNMLHAVMDIEDIPKMDKNPCPYFAFWKFRLTHALTDHSLSVEKVEVPDTIHNFTWMFKSHVHYPC